MQLLPFLQKELRHTEGENVFWFRRELKHRVTCGTSFVLYVDRSLDRFLPCMDQINVARLFLLVPAFALCAVTSGVLTAFRRSVDPSLRFCSHITLMYYVVIDPISQGIVSCIGHESDLCPVSRFVNRQEIMEAIASMEEIISSGTMFVAYHVLCLE